MVVGCGLPFNIVSNVHFKNFIAKLNPEYVKVLPSRKVLSATLLDQLYNEVIASAKKYLCDEGCFLGDGWKNVSGNHQNFAVCIHNAKGPAFFVDSYDMSRSGETGSNIAEAVSY